MTPLARILGITQLDSPVSLPEQRFDRSLDAGLRLNPAAHALPLIEALMARREGVVPLAYGADAPYALEPAAP